MKIEGLTGDYSVDEILKSHNLRAYIKHRKLQMNPNGELMSDKKSDMKAALGGKKPPLAHVSIGLLNYTARAHQYGAHKYAIGNYLRPSPDGDDVGRLLDYISAAQRHLAQWSDSIIRFLGEGKDKEETKEKAVYSADPESGLPHSAHATASLSMALQQAIDVGLLPADPGITWTDNKS